MNENRKTLRTALYMKRITAPISAIIFICAAVFGFKPDTPLETPKPVSNQSEIAFEKVMSVVTHQRCMNCHPVNDLPRQGDDSHMHRFGVQRGEKDHGIAALKCNTCHQTENNQSSGVPGAPHWALAPIKMGWQGLTKYQIAAAMLDRTKNGNRSLKDIEHHLTEDQLVLWAFEPGVDQDGKARTKPPLSKEEWIASVKTWIASGAKIPATK